MKAAKDEQISRDSNGRTRKIREDVEGVISNDNLPVLRNLLTRARSRPSPGFTNDKGKSPIQSQCQTPSRNSVEMSRPQAENSELTARNTSNENNTPNNKMHRQIDDEEKGSSLKPPNLTHQPSQQLFPIDTSEEYFDEERAEIPSSSASTASSFLQAAAIPPRLISQKTTPGAVCVPGLIGSFDDDQHDNLLDMEDGNDEGNIRNHSSGMFSRFSSSRRSQGSTVLSPMSTFSASNPIVAELAPSYPYSEREVEDRLAERLEARMEAQMDAQISQRLQQEVDRRFPLDKRQHAIAEVINSDGIESISNTKDEKKEEENFKICGIRRTWWGMIICVIMLLTFAGVGGTYLWYSRAREIVTNNTANSSPNMYTTAPTISPMPSFTATANTSSVPQATEIVNLTAMSTPSPTPQESIAPTKVSSMPLSTEDRRREYLITSIAPYVVPDEFVDLPATYFANSTYAFQNDALDWVTTSDSQTNIFEMPIQLLVERFVLAVLYYSTGGPQMWTESLSFLSSSSVCHWNNDHDIRKEIVADNVTIEDNPNVPEESIEYTLIRKGVFCDGGSLLVTSIQIPNNSLEGKVPWELSLLKDLSQIDFDTNSFYGSIPTELGRLNKLEAVWFKSNDLTGRLPIEFSNVTELASIDIEDNSITGTLPSEWGSLHSLFYVGLRLNGITGTLPSHWRTLNRLKTLDFEGNELRGTIPEEYGELTELESLYLESNNLTGRLPTELSNATNLANLFVEDNLFSGTVPTEYSSLVNLEYFWFHRNSLTGSVDSTLCDSFLNPRGANLKSNCLDDALVGVAAQIQCSCCTTCCDSNGTNCEENASQ